MPRTDWKHGLLTSWTSALALALALRAPCRAQQAREPVPLAWHVPGDVGCPTFEDLQQRVSSLDAHRAIIWGDEAVASPAGLHILSVASGSPGSWHARVTLLDGAGRSLGSREVVASTTDCRALDVPVALVVATLLDAFERETLPRHNQGSHEQPGRSARAGVGVGALLATAVGLGPKPWFGMGAELELSLGQLPVRASASAYLPGEALDGDGRGFRYWGFHGGLSMCPRLLGDALKLQVCAGPELGGTSGQGVGLDPSRRALVPVVLLAMEPRLVLRVKQGWSLQVSAAAGWAPVRARFRWIVGDARHTWEGDPFVLLARIGVIDFFP